MQTKISIDRLVARERDQHYKLTMFLNRDQIEDLTDAKRNDKQVRWLMDKSVDWIKPEQMIQESDFLQGGSK